MGEFWDDNEFPLAYLFTLRTYGTWLHGDERESVDRHGKNIYGAKRIAGNLNLKEKMLAERASAAFLFDKKQRECAEKTIKEVCSCKNYFLHAVNVRTNHIHSVVSAQTIPEKIINSFKTYVTRNLRQKNLISADRRVWSRGGSRRYLWKQKHVDLAIDYVLYCQDDVVFNIDEGELHTR
jgi:REP element-mobilizing transposase RayT